MKKKEELIKSLNHRIYVHSVKPITPEKQTLITVLEALIFLVDLKTQSPAMKKRSEK